MVLTNRQTGKLKLIFLGGRADEKFSLFKNWHDSFGTRLLGKEKLSIFCPTHEQIYKTCRGNKKSQKLEPFKIFN
jgi:hypothetical protein